MNRYDEIRQLQQQLHDLAKRLDALARLDVNPPASGFLQVDGSVPLTAEWDIGEDMAIRSERIEARDSEGLRLEDDGGNLGVFVEDGGQVGIGTNNPGTILEVEGASPRVGIDASSGNPSIVWMEGGTNQWGILYNTTSNLLDIFEDGVADWITIADGTGVTTFNGLITPVGYVAYARSGVLTIGDDAATTISPPPTFPGFADGFGVLVVYPFTGGVSGYSGIICCRSGATAAAIFAMVAGANLNVTTGALTGTTGTDVRLTVSVHTDGLVYLENRSGSNLRLGYAWL